MSEALQSATNNLGFTVWGWWLSRNKTTLWHGRSCWLLTICFSFAQHSDPNAQVPTFLRVRISAFISSSEALPAHLCLLLDSIEARGSPPPLPPTLLLLPLPWKVCSGVVRTRTFQWRWGNRPSCSSDFHSVLSPLWSGSYIIAMPYEHQECSWPRLLSFLFPMPGIFFPVSTWLTLSLTSSHCSGITFQWGLCLLSYSKLWTAFLNLPYDAYALHSMYHPLP